MLYKDYNSFQDGGHPDEFGRFSLSRYDHLDEVFPVLVMNVSVVLPCLLFLIPFSVISAALHSTSPLFPTVLLRTLPPCSHFFPVLSMLLFVSRTHYPGAAEMGWLYASRALRYTLHFV